MTEKQFISKDESIINVATDELVNASSEESAKIIVDWLNELSEENEQLYELIDFANTLIAFKTSEFCQNEWEKRLKEVVDDC